MILNKLTADAAGRYAVRSILLVTIVLSLITNVLLAAVLVLRKDTHRETFIPPTINRSFWVDGMNLDPVYLEEMSVFLLKLYTDVTPSDAEYNGNTLLRYVAPASYGAIQKVVLAIAAELKTNNATQAFAIRSISPKPETRKVLIGGQAATYVGDRRTSEELRFYLLSFEFVNGRLYLSELRQVDENTSRAFSEGRDLPAADVASGTEPGPGK